MASHKSNPLHDPEHVYHGKPSLPLFEQVSCGDDSRYDAGCRYPTERPAGIPQAPTRRGSPPVSREVAAQGHKGSPCSDVTQTFQQSHGEQAHARKTDPQTSHAAAKSVKGITETQKYILKLLREKSLTDEQLIEWYEGDWAAMSARNSIYCPPKASPSGIRSRRAELVRMGLVEDSGKTAKISTGRMATIWRLK